MSRTMLLRHLITLFIIGSEAQAAPLLIIANEGRQAPAIISNHGNLTGGMLLELGQALAQEAKQSVKYQLFPRKRLERMAGQGRFDYVCLLNPAWLPATMPLRWGPAMLDESNVLLFRSGTHSPASIQEIYGETLSTVLGYRYSSLETLFQQGQLKRSDALTEEQLMRKVQAGREHYGIINRFSLRWFNRSLPAEQRLQEGLVINSASLHCAVPAKHPQANILLGHLQRLQDKGFFHDLQSRYLKQ
ncbi:substrate-binding periplasmic protein [Chitinibacter sp. S2-10]|uniref:substrate-binding periplasmic protein n=1 Tax=Chitinibacter sp. S2-10 TaxID=3373597 RepID=UPI003977D409